MSGTVTPVSEHPTSKQPEMHSSDGSEKLSLWQILTEVHINPLNGKCTTLPILSLKSHYSRNFHL